MAQPYKICPRCQEPAALNASVCGRCGHHYRTQFLHPERTQAILPSMAPATQMLSRWDAGALRANVGLIAAQWFLTGIALTLWVTKHRGLALFCDGGATICAILLVRSHSMTDRWNGWIKICLVIVLFVGACAARHYLGRHGVAVRPFGRAG